MIQYLEFTPASHLLPFIECFWMLKSQGNFFKKRELIIPGGRVELIFNLGDAVEWTDSKTPAIQRSFTGAYFLGPRNRPFYVQQNHVVEALGVRFRHGGVASFISAPANILTNVVLEAYEIFGDKINDLTQRIYETSSHPTSITLIQNFLTNHIHNESDTRLTMRLISRVKESEASTLHRLSEATGIHYKKMERLFSRYTGYNPKNFTRVIRFYKTLKEMHSKPASLTGIGLDGGYYDQPHFIREFKAFTGTTPSQFTSENPTIANFLLRSKHV